MGGPRLGDFQAGVLASLLGAGSAMVIGGAACLAMAVGSRWWAPQLWSYHGEELRTGEPQVVSHGTVTERMREAAESISQSE